MARFEQIGQVIRDLRTERGWTQAELAERAELTGALLSSYETGRKKPSLPNLGRVLDALGVDLGQLDVHLDRVNEREVTDSSDGARGHQVPGVDLPRFLGRQTLPREMVEPFSKMVLGFQTVARRLCDRLLDTGSAAGNPPGGR